MKPFTIVVIIFRFIAVCLVVYWAFIFVCSFLPATPQFFNRDGSLDVLISSAVSQFRTQSLTYIIAGTILYFAAPLLAWFVTREGIDDPDGRKDVASPEPPVTLRWRRTSYLVIIGVLVVLGGSIILLLTR